MKGIRSCLSVAALGAALFVNPSARAALVSVDFGTPGSPLVSGVEASAAALNAGFGAANQWNGLNVASLTTTANPSFSGLVDSTGAATTVGFAITGGVGGYNNNSNPLSGDYLYWHGGSVNDRSISWALSGLIAGQTYAMVFYGGNDSAPRDADFLVDTNGNGLLTDETVASLVNGSNALTSPLYYASVAADATGRIIGSSTATGNLGFTEGEANWGGFQLLSLDSTPVPEPGSLPLVGIALALSFALRGKSRSAR